MATINDVARLAGVSKATISRVLANPEIVSRDMRERVMQVIDRVGYVPNSVAASLKTQRTARIIVTVPDISNPFFSNVIRGVEEAASEAGYYVLLGDTRHDRDREEQYARMFLRREADGFIFLGHRLPDALAGIIAREGGRAPIVNGCEFSPSLGVSSAHIDNAKAAAGAMDSLYRLGHRDIAVITGPASSPLTRDRLTGARLSAERHGFADRFRTARGDFSIESGRRAAVSLLEAATPLTAIFCFSDEMAIGAMAALRAKGVDCPRQVSVIGFDDIQMARYVHPPLTTVRQPMRQIGRETVSLLLAILDGKHPEPVSLTLAHSIIGRQSVARAPEA